MAIVDLFGPFGGPAFLYDKGDWGRENSAFKIGVQASGSAVQHLTFDVGRYYVDGWACSTRRGTYNTQADLPFDPNHSSHDVFKLPNGFPFLVYLDVWERHVTSLEDESIREVALGGHDAAARARLVCQVRCLADQGLPAGINALTDFKHDTFTTWWSGVLQKLHGENRPRLKVETKRPADAAARYIGPENQLYRVEIHDVDSTGKATFKFSRNNGSDVAALKKIEGKILTIGGAYEPERAFSAGQWIELTNDERELLGLPGILVLVTRVEGNELTINPDSAVVTPDPNQFKTNTIYYAFQPRSRLCCPHFTYCATR